jgi:DNA-binding MarR family transcriptional regulator
MSNVKTKPLYFYLSEIGELFKMDYSAVSQAAKRFEQKSEINHEIKEIMQKVITALKEV